MGENLVALEPPSLSHIKNVEMYTKKLPFVADEYKDETCPKSAEHGTDGIQRGKREKTKQKRDDAKKASKTNTVLQNLINPA
eukprot:8175266-Ditylum_brightwellii.AAC.1